MQFENFLQLNKLKQNHAVLLTSKQFEQHAIPNNAFCQFAEKICDINLKNLSAEEFYHPDVLIIDRKRNQLRLEDVKGIKDFCLYPPQIGTHRLVFIENCERLNLNSANFILKSLEEPPAQVIFLFTSAHKHMLLPTILSRMQTFDIFFRSLAKKRFIEEFDADTLKFFENIMLSSRGLTAGSTSEKIFFGKSLTDSKNFHIQPEQLADLISHCEQLAKKYTSEQLRCLIVYCVSERLKKEATFVIMARFIIAHIRAWKRIEQLNPSSQFWLLRIFLGQQNNEQYANN